MAFSDFASIEASKNRKAIEAVAASNGQIIEQLGNINHKLGQLIDSAKKGIAILERQSKEGQQPASKKPRRCKSEESESPMAPAPVQQPMMYPGSIPQCHQMHQSGYCTHYMHPHNCM